MNPQRQYIAAFFLSLLVVVLLMLLAAAVKPEVFNLVRSTNSVLPGQHPKGAQSPKSSSASDTDRDRLSQQVPTPSARLSFIDSAGSEKGDLQAYRDSLAALRVQLEQRERMIVELTKRLQGLNAVADSGTSTSAKTTARLLESMSAEEAARILRNMNEPEVKAILAAVKKRQAGKILGALEPERAARYLR